MILPLTGGGPARRTEVVSLYMYRSAFYDLDAGKAAAIAVVMLAVNAALAWGAGAADHAAAGRGAEALMRTSRTRRWLDQRLALGACVARRVPAAAALAGLAVAQGSRRRLRLSAAVDSRPIRRSPTTCSR